MTQYLKLLIISLSLTSCFQAANQGIGSHDRSAPKQLVSKEVSNAKSIATVDASSTIALKMSVSDTSPISGTSISIAPGSLQISADIIVEQGADLSSTTLTQEVALAGDVSITGAGNGVIIRPSVATVLQKPITLNIPLPVGLGLNLAAVNYAVYYKYLDPTKNQLMTGFKIVDGTAVKLVFDDTSKRDSLQFDGYFGIYWIVALSREVLPAEVPAEKVSVQAIVNKSNTVVINSTGIVADAQVVVTQAKPDVVWVKPTLTFAAATRSAQLTATMAATLGLKNCKADFFASVNDVSGVSIDGLKDTNANAVLAKFDTQNLVGRFRCSDASDRLTLSPWSDPLAIPAYAKAKVVLIDSNSNDGLYKAGTFVFSVNFDRIVTVSGTPGLGLNLKPGGRAAVYQSGSGTTNLIFGYTTLPGDETKGLNVSSDNPFDLTNGTIRDALSVDADLTFAATSVSNSLAKRSIAVDAVLPTPPTSVAFSSATTPSASFSLAWSASTDANFRYHNVKVCLASDCATGCTGTSTSISSPLTMSGVNGTVYYGCVQGEDLAGNQTPFVSSISPILVDTTPSSILSVGSSTANGYYKVGASVDVSVQFTENVMVTGIPTFTLETGTTDRIVSYTSGNGSNTLHFTYSVQAGDVNSDLDAQSTSALALAGGTIKDAAGNNAILTLPALGGAQSLAGQKAIVIDTTIPSLPSSISFLSNPTRTTTVTASYGVSTDSNFRYHNAKLCAVTDCITSCTGSTTSTTSPVNLIGMNQSTYYACIQGEDFAGNLTAWTASSTAVKVGPTFTGVASGEVLGSFPDGTAKIELTFLGTPSAVDTYKVYFSTSSSIGTFDFANPIAFISAGDAIYDATINDTKLLLSVAANLLQDGYYVVRYFDTTGSLTDPNAMVSTVVNVLRDKPGYVLIPKRYSGLSYDYFIMRFEASLSSSGTNAGGDTVTTTEASLTGCSYKFHVNGTAADPSCGSKVITKAAESTYGVTPQASISWPTAYYACRNASNTTAKVRMPSAEEWRRASKWIGSSYADMWTNYTNNAGGNCNVIAGSAASTGTAALCKTALGVQDMAGNLREWVDNRMLQYSISGNTESRFSYGPTIGRSLPNGIDNIVQRFHTLDPGAGGLALTLGADFKSPTFADQKQYGTNVQTWTDPATASSDAIGFRCLGFRADTMPTMSQLALPDEPKFVAGDLATAGLVPENLYVKDNRWENVAITISGNTTDAVAEGRVNVTWQPWSKTTCNTSGTCIASDLGLVYKLYRFTEPNHQSIRVATPWALGNLGSNYLADKPIDPLAVDISGSRLFTSSTSDGALLATISNCVAATPANCTYADLSTINGGSLVVGKIYNYLLIAEDANGNAIVPSVQRYRSPYFTGPASTAASAFRMEPRLRRASVFLVDEYYQQNQTRPQIMVHVPMDKSGLDHDFFIQKYEASLYDGSVSNNSPAGANAWPTQGTATAWVKNAALCQDVFLQTGTFDPTGCGNGTVINASTATVQSKQGTAPLVSIDQGASWKACRHTTLGDSDGKNYSLQLAGDSEWLKAADWGDTNQDGTIEASVNPFTGGQLSITALESGAGDMTTVRCHTDNNPASAMTSNSTGVGSTSNCRSRYGAADMIGNVWDWTAGQISTAAGQDNGMDGLWLGQTFLTGTNVTFASLGSGNYDLLRGLPKTTSAASVVYDSGDYYYYSSGLRGSVRGGTWYDGSFAGRWSLHVSSTPLFVTTDLSLRCAL
ncbi:MAG: SUMF1/EgtB/PvdO family nonheme iron enzyme [Oligoflexus sp.]|nr:SUMF1/EgtB/PvdO family nonheme iron enzyme [Oligoflexus sp.]